MNCAMVSEAVAKGNARGPTPIDSIATRERIDVSCETKSILTHYSRKETAASQQPAGPWRGGSTTLAEGVVFEIKADCDSLQN